MTCSECCVSMKSRQHQVWQGRCCLQTRSQRDVALPGGSVRLVLGSFPQCFHTHMQIQTVVFSEHFLVSDMTKVLPLMAAFKDCCCWLIYNCFKFACLAKERKKCSPHVSLPMTSQPSGSVLTMPCSQSLSPSYPK